MVVACERFLMATPQPHGSLALLLTSDEEGPAVDGTRRVIETLQTRAEAIDWCLVGEPSSEGLLGDTAKIGRRGSLHGHLRLLGQQGHVAYPLLAENPIHGAGGLIVCLAQEVWDLGNEFFPPTTFQISNIHGGTGVSNVIPGEITLQFNFRFCPESSPESLRQRTVQLIERHLSNEELRAQRRYGFELDWDLAGEPFLTPLGELVEAAQSASLAVLGRQPRLSTAGGTSDGRFIAPTGAQVLELGPINASIHKVNEHVAVADLDRLSELYEAILVRLLGG
jgi:succinyl-diaminopimelate desuccinylase